LAQAISAQVQALSSMQVGVFWCQRHFTQDSEGEIDGSKSGQEERDEATSR